MSTPSEARPATSRPNTGKFAPKFNKLFMNKLRGLIEEEFSFKNIDKTKKDLLQKYGVPINSKIYNYKQVETRKISNRYSDLLPKEVR